MLYSAYFVFTLKSSSSSSEILNAPKWRRELFLHSSHFVHDLREGCGIFLFCRQRFRCSIGSAELCCFRWLVLEVELHVFTALPTNQKFELSRSLAKIEILLFFCRCFNFRGVLCFLGCSSSGAFPSQLYEVVSFKIYEKKN